MKFADGFERICHFHIAKCAGTTVNSWMALAVPDHRTWQERWLREYEGEAGRVGEDTLETKRLAVEDKRRRIRMKTPPAFYWADAIYSHFPIVRHARPGTFCFTILRNPVDRLVSQVADWRRLNESDVARLPKELGEAKLAAGRLRLVDYLTRYGVFPYDYAVNNHIVNALAASCLGGPPHPFDPPESLIELAQISLSRDFDLIGLTDDIAQTLRRLAVKLGLPPPADFPRQNVTGSSETLAEEREEAAEILDQLTRHDRVIYDRAQRLTEACPAVTFEEAEALFERRHAASATAQLDAVNLDGCPGFSVRGPMIGSGLHPRDAAGTPACRIWTGPGCRSILYMPVPKGARVNLRVWVHGYAHEAVRETLSTKVYDRPVAHSFAPLPGWREAIVVPAYAEQSWIKLTIDVGETLRDPGPAGDSRKRGVSFDYYGWAMAAGD